MISIHELAAWVVASGLGVTLVSSKLREKRMSSKTLAPKAPSKVTKFKAKAMALNLPMKGRLPSETVNPFLEEEKPDPNRPNKVSSDREARETRIPVVKFPQRKS
jgi:hypothetical protein